MRTRAIVVGLAALLLALLLMPASRPASAHAVSTRLADVMGEVSRRFTTLGGAIVARDDDRARYEMRQLRDLFEREVLLATPPRSLTGMDLEPLRRGFVEGPLRALDDAVGAHDWSGSASTFDAAANACNDCHRTTGVPFLAVPGLPKPVAQPALAAPRSTKSKVRTSPPR